MYASSGGHETVCREDEERILCKYLTNNALQRLHDWAATTARLDCNDCTIGPQRPHDWTETTARLGRNDRTIELQRLHDWAAMSA